MKTLLAALSLIVLSAASASAQTLDRRANDAVAWSRPVVAQRISDVAAFASFALPCASDRQRACFERQALRSGVTILLSEVVKRTVPRTRPDGSDRKSFWSEHTAVTCVSGFGSKREAIGAALCGAVAYLRMAGGRHWLSDVATGAAVGFSVSRIGR